MKRNTALILICFGICGVRLCVAQSNAASGATNRVPFAPHFWNGVQPAAPIGATNWGKAVQGVRLSITMTNSVVQSGSSSIIVAVITNCSTNFVELGVTNPEVDFDPILTDGSGKVLHLIARPPPPLLTRSSTVMTMNPGEQCVWVLSVPFGNGIAPGGYTLQASRGFKTSDGSFKLESNPLKIQVK